jgi:triphosphoribosyl-dephospho-CoA synthase
MNTKARVTHLEAAVRNNELRSKKLGKLASEALIIEATLTPKPALVDKRGSGVHSDLTLALMLKSAIVLEPFFVEMARIACGANPCLELRESLAECGRRAEEAMLDATGGSNSHRGAIWCIGLLVAAASMHSFNSDCELVAGLASQIAVFADRNSPAGETHGLLVQRKYGAGGARIEAQKGFPHVVEVGLKKLRGRRLLGATDTVCQLDAMLAIMSSLDDTCLLYRGGLTALETAMTGAKEILLAGGTETAQGMCRLFQLDKDLSQLGASPGGSADLLAATIFLDSLDCPVNF